MTAFATSNLPANINTLERLVVWSNSALYTLHRNTRYRESDASPLIPIITAQDGLAADETERIIFRVSMPLDPDWRGNATKIFSEALEISNVAIPTAFLTA